VATFVGGLLATAFALPGLSGDVGPRHRAELRRLRLLGSVVVTPALVLVWGLGITLATKGGWFASPWLHAKIALVLLLSGLHGYQMRRVRRLATGQTVSRGSHRWIPLTIASITAAIVILATAKPGS
jgi:putative membrane protein